MPSNSLRPVFAWLRSKLTRAELADLEEPSVTETIVARAMETQNLPSAEDLGEAQAEFEQGNWQLQHDHPDIAERHYRRALAIHPGHAEVCCNLGGLLKDRGQLTEAEQWLTLAIKHRPNLAPAYYNLGMICINQSRWAEAAEFLRRSLGCSPAQPDAQYWLGNALAGIGDVRAARKAYISAVRLDANYVQARWGNTMAQLPAVARDEAEQAQAAGAFAREIAKLQAWFRASQSSGGYLAVGAQQPYYLAYIESNHREILSTYGSLCTALMAGWSDKTRLPLPATTGNGRCRIGIVSAHIHSHSVWHAFVRGWIEHLDPAKFELQIFHTGSRRDVETEWAIRRVARLHHALGDWTVWAKVILDSRLDALIYPEIGMDSTTVRLSALRLARVQLAAWGHPITTGLPSIDGFISAEAFESSVSTTHYSEKLVLLPRLGCSYKPFGTPAIEVDTAVWGIESNDKILLCAGAAFKYLPAHDSVLVEIARRCQPCKLVFFRGVPDDLSRLLELRLRLVFEGAGMSFDNCVRFVPWQSQAAFFGLLDRATVYLDSLGFSGFNTTMQAIERGTPIVAFEGEFMRGRFASAILRQMGLDEWVATSSEQYVQLVERLTLDRGAQNAVRRRISVSRHQLFDDRQTVAALGERVLRLCANPD